MQTLLSEFDKLEKISERGTMDFPPIYSAEQSHILIKELIKLSKEFNFDFERMLDIFLAVLESREEDYMTLIKDMKKELLQDYCTCFGLLLNFFLEGYYDDILGQVYSQIINPKYTAGYFITPFHISLCMAELLDLKPTETLCEPAVGSGSMVLAAKFVIHKKYGWIASCNYIKNMFGMDIGSTQIKMCKIQLYLADYLYMINLVHSKIMEIKEHGKTT